MSFDDTGREPEQAFRLNRDPLAELEYPTKWVQRWHSSFCTAEVWLHLSRLFFSWCKCEHVGFQVFPRNHLRMMPWSQRRTTVRRFHKRNQVSVCVSKIVLPLPREHEKGHSRCSIHAGSFRFDSLLSLHECVKLKRCLPCRLFSSRRIARFSNVQHLSIHISKNFGEENTRVYFIGLRGEYSEVSREFTGCGVEALGKTTQCWSEWFSVLTKQEGSHDSRDICSQTDLFCHLA